MKQQADTTRKLWERSLADFSARNPLIAFKGKNALKLLVPDADRFMQYLTRKGGARLKGGGREESLLSEREKLLLEEKLGVVRTALPDGEVDSLASKLRRKTKEALEETGARSLFIACGFLHYCEGSEMRLAPVVLLPAELSVAKGKDGFSLAPSGEPFVNATLLEYLYQEFNIDVRYLENSERSVQDTLEIIKRETAEMAGWSVTDEVYLAAFFFQRFLMWNDLREHFHEFGQNANIQALCMEQTHLPQPMPAIEPHKNAGGAPMSEIDGMVVPLTQQAEGAPMTGGMPASAEDLVLPLPSDATQRAAVALSERGTSFVLHGPPGTGKSQTITNMIAHALEAGKSVLFVAGKRAAIEVVKRRLDEIGIGDFCLELSNTDQGEAFKQFRRTLLLKPIEGETEDSGEYLAARRAVQEKQDALFQKRKLSLSVHEAILNYFERKGSADLLKIGGDFYESLNDETLIECKQLILSAAAAAKECGGVFNSPFENVNLKEYSEAVRDRALLAGRALLGAGAHLKCFLALLLDFFGQKIGSFTEEKARRLAEIVSGLLAGKYDRYFKDISLEEFFKFRSANLRLESNLTFYAKHFKLLLNIEEEYKELSRFVSEGGKLNGAAVALKKRLERVALHPLHEEDIPKYIASLVGIYDARRELAACALSQYITDRGGQLSKRKSEKFLAPLKELSALAASVFAQFSPERFFEGCIRAASGCAEPLFQGYQAALDGFIYAKEHYLTRTKAESRRTEGEDILDYYAAKAAALLENADLLRARCDYKAAQDKLEKRGMKFIGDALESGALTPDTVLSSFEKSLKDYFLSVNLARDPLLLRMTSGGVESEAEQFALLQKRQMLQKRRHIRNTLIARLPQSGECKEELSLLFRLEKGTRRGRMRNLFLNAPALMKKLCPCLLLSPDAAAQYLAPRANEYDLVIFDEASQMMTSEAAGALARAKQAIIVGDNCQLPPTPFFRTAFSQESEEDLESVLDAALAAGFEERSLLWHYRSRHESLIAFSNATYYENRLNTFPSPVAAESRVSLRRVEGVYDRARTKRNRGEAEALVAEVVRRLSDPELSKKSIGVVTFSNVQREEIEKILSREIAARSLEEVAYGAEPLFVKNLENVQGDERDLILFSVGYGYDREGKLSYNFGALNRAGGWRRLNVACSRAREEMVVFSSISPADIDLRRTSSKGVAGLKAFLEFADSGKLMPSLPPERAPRAGIGQYLAEELTACGYASIAGMGVGHFKIDVAVPHPSDKNRYILGIVVNGSSGSAVDSAVLLPEALKRNGWNIMSVSEVAYYNNPKREVKRIKDYLDLLTGEKQEGALVRYSRPYRFVKTSGGRTAAFVTDGKHDTEIEERLEEIVKREQPISRAFLRKRCMQSFGIARWGAQAQVKLDALIARLKFPVEKVGGVEYFYKNPKTLLPEKFRREGRSGRRKTAEDFTPFETAVLIKAMLQEKVTLYEDELVSLVSAAYGAVEEEGFSAFVANAVDYGQARGMFRRSISGRISL